MATQKPTATTEGAKRQLLQVIAKRDGFRRAGRGWHGTSTVALDELTEEQRQQLATEPMLVTQLVDAPADAG